MAPIRARSLSRRCSSRCRPASWTRRKIPLAQIYPARFYEVQKYLSMTGHVYTPAYVTAGASWKKLPPEVQKILDDTAREMEPVALKIAADLDEQLLEKLKDAGIR